MLVCLVGFWCIYPEMLSLVAAFSASIVLYQFFTSEDRGYFFRRLTVVVLAAGCTVALCAFAWSLTVGYLLVQARWIAKSSIADTADWWKITQRYLFGFDTDPNTAFDFIALWHRSFGDFFYHLLSVVTNFLAGLLGVYFLQPGHMWAQPDQIWIGYRIAWRIALLASLAALLGFWLRGLLRTSGEPRQRLQRTLFAGVLGGLTLIGGLVLTGQSWAAGRL